MKTSYAYFDLEGWLWTEAPEDPTRCWLMVKDNRCLDRLDWRRAFLLSLNDGSPPADGLARRLLDGGQATTLVQARAFLEGLDQGEISPCAVQRVFAQLRACCDVAPEVCLARERRVFSRQFDCRETQRGLRGFLAKEARPFSTELKTTRARSAWCEWLDW